MKAGGPLLALLALVALAGPSLVGHAPLAQDRERVDQPPSVASLHLLGTDWLGRDVLARTLHAARYTLLTAAAGVVLALVLGTAAGAVAGFLGGLWDHLLMRGAELTMTLPALYLIIGVRNLFPDSVPAFEAGLIVAVSLAAVAWGSLARLVRGQVLSIRERDYVSAARAAGASRHWILGAHVLRALRPFLLLQLGLQLPYFLLGEVTLSYLGLGLPEPHPTFGNMLAGAVPTAAFGGSRWWTWVPPALLLTLAVMGANLWVDALRSRYGVELESGSGGPGFETWAKRASRLLSSSIWGSKHLRQRAS